MTAHSFSLSWKAFVLLSEEFTKGPSDKHWVYTVKILFVPESDTKNGPRQYKETVPHYVWRNYVSSNLFITKTGNIISMFMVQRISCLISLAISMCHTHTLLINRSLMFPALLRDTLSVHKTLVTWFSMCIPWQNESMIQSHPLWILSSTKISVLFYRLH